MTARSTRRGYSLAVVDLLFLAGVLLIDFPVLSVFRYFLLSDLLILLSYLTLCAATGRVPWCLRPALLYLSLAAYALSSLVSLLRAPEPGDSLFTLFHLMFLALVYVPMVSAVLCARPRLLRLTVGVFIFITLGRSIDFILLPLSGVEWAYGSRLYGVSGAAALYVMFPGMVTLWLLLVRGWPRREGGGRAPGRLITPVLALGGLVIFSVGAMISRSRSIWVASVVGIMLIGVATPGRRVRWTLVYPALAVVLVVLLAVGDLIPQAVVKRFYASFDPSAPDVVARQEVVWRLWPRVTENPLVGIGFENSKHFPPPGPGERRVDAVHNLLLSNLVENGALALVALAALPLVVLFLWRRIEIRGGPRERFSMVWAGASFGGLYAAGQLTPNMLEHTFWFLLAYVAGLAVESERGPEMPGPRAHDQRGASPALIGGGSPERARG